MLKGRFEGNRDRDDPTQEDLSARCVDAMESRRIGPVVGRTLPSQERRSVMHLNLASSNPHGTIPQSMDTDWSESDHCPAWRRRSKIVGRKLGWQSRVEESGVELLEFGSEKE
ncbi:Serine/threonine-protein kinase CTR1 [Hordeum vulgare]|nr:Serine/threonine-protein kinase CTR1 [Hordeum vulgare]